MKYASVDTKMLSKIESLILGIFFGFLPLVFCLLVTVIVASILFGKKSLGAWELWSLVPGVIIDIVFLKKWVKNAYQLNNRILVAIYLFYSVVALGMGMGVPIFNLALGILAGIYIARKMHIFGADEEQHKQAFRRMAMFCSAAMVMVCCLITLLAIAGQMIGYRFETPWLSFTFTVPVFFTICFTGGSALVLLQYWLTLAAAKTTFRLSGVSRNL